MKKSKIIIESILLGLIVLVSTLLIIRPYVLAMGSKEEEKPAEIKEEKTEETINKGKALLGVNVLVEGQGIKFDAENNAIIINERGEYELVGNFANGQIIIDTAEEVKLIFQGINLTGDRVLLENKQNSNLSIELMASSYNTLKTTSSSDILTNKLTIEGSGTLSLINQNGDGISGENVSLNSGNIYIFASSKAITGKLNIKYGNVILFGNELLNNIEEENSQPIMQVNLINPLTETDTITLVDENNNEFIKGNPFGSAKAFLISGPYLKNGNYFILKNEAKIILNDSEVITINNLINNFVEK